jgi:hypothetical protein
MVSAMAPLLRLAALVTCAIVLIGFLSFANDEASKGSAKQIDKLSQAMNDPSPGANAERVREKKHGKAREFVDDANDVLLKPFAGLVDSEDVWVTRIVPTVLALLLYGLGLTLLANFLPKRRPKSTGDWRTAT